MSRSEPNWPMLDARANYIQACEEGQHPPPESHCPCGRELDTEGLCPQCEED